MHFMCIVFKVATTKAYADLRVKAPCTHDVQKYTALGVGSCIKYSAWVHLMLYLPLNPTLILYFPRITQNGASTYTYYTLHG